MARTPRTAINRSLPKSKKNRIRRKRLSARPRRIANLRATRSRKKYDQTSIIPISEAYAKKSRMLFTDEYLPENFSMLYKEYLHINNIDLQTKRSHDDIRSHLITFLSKAFKIKPEKFVLEKGIKAHRLRGRMDALYKQIIIEVKTDFAGEKEDALNELAKYFSAQKCPEDYLALVTNGRLFDIYIQKAKVVEQIKSFCLEEDKPSQAFQFFDQVFFISKYIRPTSEDIVIKYGPQSTTYQFVTRSLSNALEQVKDDSSVKIKYSEWHSLLAKVYGREDVNQKLFVVHTYLVMLARVIVAKALFPGRRCNDKAYRGMLDGEFFKNNRLANLAEPDFFAWPLNTPVEQTAISLLRGLMTCLDEYDFSKLQCDVFKEVYENLIGPKARYDLAEYYTPDWLAELMINETKYNGETLLDPSCGSGAFLIAAAERIKEINKNRSATEIIREISKNVIGVDVHPVAVLMAKANLILNLKSEFENSKDELNLQIYMSDTLGTEEHRKANALVINVKDDVSAFMIPYATVNRGPTELDELIDKMCEFATIAIKSAEHEHSAHAAIKQLLKDRQYISVEQEYWEKNFLLLVRLEKEKRNTIWSYILKNAYRPVYLRENKVKYIVGNPPWKTYSDIEHRAYKDRVAQLAYTYKLLNKNGQAARPHIDTCTVFFAHCVENFLVENGTIAFVMPKSTILHTEQHLGFQRMGFAGIHDLENVEPLFKVPSCFLVRSGKRLQNDIPYSEYTANFEGRKNLQLEDAIRALKVSKSTYNFMHYEVLESPYAKLFSQGADLFYRCYWFVEPICNNCKVVNQDRPKVQTARKFAKKKNGSDSNNEKIIEGQIEREFLFASVLEGEIVPFGIKRFEPIVLPIKVTPKGDVQIINKHQVLKSVNVGAYKWLEEVEEDFEKESKGKTIYVHINYKNKLTKQNLKRSFYVIQNASGKNLSAAIIINEETKNIAGLKVGGFVADNKTYWYATEDEEEALYLVGVLNSNYVDQAIKPFQSKGQSKNRGVSGRDLERDVHLRAFKVCHIPKYNGADKQHKRIVGLAKQCIEAMTDNSSWRSVCKTRSRRYVREMLQPILSKIDKEVEEMLNSQKCQKNLKKKHEQLGLY